MPDGGGGMHRNDGPQLTSFAAPGPEGAPSWLLGRVRPSGWPGGPDMTPTDIPVYMAHVGAQARAASAAMARAPLAARDAALRALARQLREQSDALQEVNRGDVAKAAASGLA